MKTILAAVVALAALGVRAEFKMDKSVMSDAYWKVWNDDVQAKIDDDIEKFRKADASFEVAAPDGAEVNVEQLTHAFHFGATIFHFNQLGAKELNEKLIKKQACKDFPPPWTPTKEWDREWSNDRRWS